MRKPPKRSTTKAVYDKVDGPVYFAKGGKVHKYANGWTTPSAKQLDFLKALGVTDGSSLSPQDQATYDSLADSPTTGGLSATAAGGIGAGVNAVANIVDANTDNSNPMLKQAGLGAAKGAAAGLAFGGVGAAIGGGIGLVGGALAGKKQGEAADAAAKAKSDAEALAEKQRREAAAKANMNPWEIGYGMADGGKVKKSTKQISDNLLRAGENIKYVNDSILTPYARKELKLKENQPIPTDYSIPPEIVDKLTKGIPYRQSIKTLYEHAKTLPPTPFSKSIIDIAGVNEDPSVIDKLAWGYRMGNIKTPYYGEPVPTQIIKPNTKPKKIDTQVGTAPILGLKAGGKIKGSGTAKSDSIKAKVKADSFIVPEENAEVAEDIREEILGDKGDKKAELKQKGGEDVRLSNGEHMFTPEEVEEVESEGIDLDDLAPNQENGNGKADGGTIEEQIEKLLKEESDKEKLRNEAQSKRTAAQKKEDEAFAKSEQGRVRANLKNERVDKVTRELQKNLKGYKNAYSAEEKAAKLRLLQKAFGDYKEIKSAYDGTANKGVGNTSEGSISEGGAMSKIMGAAALSAAAKANEESTAAVEATTIPTTTESKKAAVNKGGIAAVGKSKLLKSLAPNAAAVVDNGGGIIPEVNPTKENVNIFGGNDSAITEPTPLGVQAAQEKLATTTNPEEKSKLQSYLSKAGKFLGDNASVIPGVAGLGVSAFQIGKGIKQLNSLGARPVDTGVMDADFAASVEQAKNDAKYGISPEERNIAERGIESNRGADIANIVNAAGGSGGTALGNIRAASNNANNARTQLSAESERLRLEKQRYANNLIGQKAGMARNLQRQKFEDSMNAFNTNQTAGSQLLGAGIQNAFGALRYTGEAMNQNKLAKTGGGAPYTGATKSSKRDYMSAAAGDETKARALANQYGENYDSLNNF